MPLAHAILAETACRPRSDAVVFVICGIQVKVAEEPQAIAIATKRTKGMDDIVA